MVVIPGTRGRNSTVGTTYTGRAPNAILDLKAAIRYLRHFDKEMLGNAEKIITDGTSAGGAESRQQGNADVLGVSNELKAQFPTYVNGLGLKMPDGTPLTADNYMDFIKSEIIRAAQIAKNAGADIPDSIGFEFSSAAGGMFAAPINGGVTNSHAPRGDVKLGTGSSRSLQRGRMGGAQVGEYITGLDIQKYLNYVVSTQPLKTAPAFDTKGVCGQDASGENDEFGDATGTSVNFTEYAATKTLSVLTDDIRHNVHLLNPMYFIGESDTDVAPHWYIRHGARDRDTSFPIPLNLALKLENAGKDVNYLLAWNRPHSGDYALDELFEWIRNITSPKK